MGCLLAGIALFSVRFALILYWILDDDVERAFHDSFILPFLGLIFLPATTLVYALCWSYGGLDGFDFVWVALAFMCDIASAAAGARNRRAAY